MASGISIAGAAAWLPPTLGIGTPPTQFYVGLATGEPRGATTGTTVAALEPSGGGYARQLYAVGPSWWAMSGPTAANSSDVVFPTPTADWGYITHFLLCSAAAFGDLFAWGVLANPQLVVENVPPRLVAGAMVLSMPVAP